MEKPDYKVEIESSRVGSLGSSDADIVLSVNRNGGITTKTAQERIAVMLGIIERRDFKTEAMAKGDRLENAIYEIIKSQFPDYTVVSNPLYVSETLSTPELKVINHIDYEVETDTQLIWIENKASVSEPAEVMNKYDGQLQWHWLLLKEKAQKLGKSATLLLSHYRTGVTDDTEFHASNLSIINVLPYAATQEQLANGLAIIRNALPAFTYEPDENEINVFDTTSEIAKLTPDIGEKLRKLKQLEEAITNYKTLLKEFIEEHGGKSVIADDFKIVYKASSSSQKFDSVRFKKDNPELYAKYLKESSVSASISIQLK